MRGSDGTIRSASSSGINGLDGLWLVTSKTSTSLFFVAVVNQTSGNGRPAAAEPRFAALWREEQWPKRIVSATSQHANTPRTLCSRDGSIAAAPHRMRLGLDDVAVNEGTSRGTSRHHVTPLTGSDAVRRCLSPGRPAWRSS